VTLIALILSIVVGEASLAWGYLQVGLPHLARWILIFGAVWLATIWQRWRWFAYIGLTFNFLAAALGLWFLNFAPGWMFAGAIAGLLAWDLTDFRYRLRFAANDVERRAVETRHLMRSTLLALLGFGLAGLAMAVKLQFNFEWAVFLALVAVLGLLQLVGWFRRRN
jgi:hypothetical protein